MPSTTYSYFSSENLMFDHKSRTFTVPPKYPLHFHNTLELFFLIKGDVTYITEEKTYYLQKNSLVISRPFEPHRIQINDFSEYERYIILFDEKKIGSSFYDALSRDICIINFEGNSRVLDLFYKLDYYQEHLTGDALKIVITHLIEEIICNASLASKVPLQVDICSNNVLVMKAQKYIHNNITEPITIDEICNALYITKSHLHHLFIKYLNISPKQYILSQKMLFSKHDLCNGLKPTDVCYTYGFMNYSTFYRTYKKYFGHSPSEEYIT